MCTPGSVIAAVDVVGSLSGSAVSVNNQAAGFGSSVGLPGGGEARTLELWVYPWGTSSGEYLNWLSTGDLSIGWHHNRREVEVSVGGERVAVWDAGANLQNNWHHVALTYDAGVLSLFVNGRNLGDRDVVLDTNLAGGLVVGRLGGFDEVAVYDTVLDIETIAQHWALGAP